MNKLYYVVTVLTVLLFAGPVLGEVDKSPINFVGSYEFNYANEMKYLEQTVYEDVSQQRLGIWGTQETIVDENLIFNMGLGGILWNPFPGNIFIDKLTNFNMLPVEVKMEYKFGDSKNSLMSLTFGQFFYKYNPDSKNLGEYIFRTISYPQTVFTGNVDIAGSSQASVRGLMFSLNPFQGKFKNDFLITTETNFAPLHDISLAYVGSYNVKNVFQVGVGFSLDRLIPFRPSETTPKNDKSLILEVPEQTVNTVSGPVIVPAWTGVKKYWGNDSLNKTLASAGIDHPDSIPVKTETRLTFKSAKFMLMSSLDFKPLIGLQTEDGWQKDQFRLYTEIIVNGIADQPFYYENISHRTAYMWGISLPTWKILDYFNFEIQYYPTKMPNNIQELFEFNHPAPYLRLPGMDERKYSPDSSIWKKNDFKWSIAAQRKVINGLTIMAQIASDHFRPINNTFHNEFSEALWKPSAWYFDIRVIYGI
ncbi:MAG: hypothetical protein HQK83_13520 [Fibrobacteria bacterium]|nr:hypothetical protein [Fibrobacteria bacterium]